MPQKTDAGARDRPVSPLPCLRAETVGAEPTPFFFAAVGAAPSEPNDNKQTMAALVALFKDDKKELQQDQEALTIKAYFAAYQMALSSFAVGEVCF